MQVVAEIWFGDWKLGAYAPLMFHKSQSPCTAAYSNRVVLSDE